MKTIFITLFSLVAAGPIRNRPVKLYAKTGKFMSIRHTGSVKPVGSGKTASLINIIPIGGERGQFIMRGAVTGLFIRVKNNRLVGTPHQNHATYFVEEMNVNNFNSYRLADRPDCRLTILSKNFKIRCHAKIRMEKMSFLPRKSHMPRFGGFRV